MSNPTLKRKVQLELKKKLAGLSPQQQKELMKFASSIAAETVEQSKVPQPKLDPNANPNVEVKPNTVAPDGTIASKANMDPKQTKLDPNANPNAVIKPKVVAPDGTTAAKADLNPKQTKLDPNANPNVEIKPEVIKGKSVEDADLEKAASMLKPFEGNPQFEEILAARVVAKYYQKYASTLNQELVEKTKVPQPKLDTSEANAEIKPEVIAPDGKKPSEVQVKPEQTTLDTSESTNKSANSLLHFVKSADVIGMNLKSVTGGYPAKKDDESLPPPSMPSSTSVLSGALGDKNKEIISRSQPQGIAGERFATEAVRNNNGNLQGMVNEVQKAKNPAGDGETKTNSELLWGMDPGVLLSLGIVTGVPTTAALIAGGKKVSKGISDRADTRVLQRIQADNLFNKDLKALRELSGKGEPTIQSKIRAFQAKYPGKLTSAEADDLISTAITKAQSGTSTAGKSLDALLNKKDKEIANLKSGLSNLEKSKANALDAMKKKHGKWALMAGGGLVGAMALNKLLTNMYRQPSNISYGPPGRYY